jgi:hypothetical protein
MGATGGALLSRDCVKLRSEFYQIIGVYRHFRACFLRLFEAAEHHINISEPWVRLEFATLARGNYCVCAASPVEPPSERTSAGNAKGPAIARPLQNGLRGQKLNL